MFCSYWTEIIIKYYHLLKIIKKLAKRHWLNTGGMGAISPVVFLDDVFLEKIEERVIKPTINGIMKENMNIWV